MTAQAMMRVKFKRPRGFNTMGRTAVKELKGLVSIRLSQGLRDMQRYIMETPVYTGNTLVNFRWAVGAPETAKRAAIKDPARPGKTSAMGIGEEPRRAANALRVQEDFALLHAEVMSNPFQRFFLNNNVEHFSDVEYGVYAREGKEDRTPPGGMTRRGEVAIEYALMGVGKRVS
jgi:hypothetical protein